MHLLGPTGSTVLREGKFTLPQPLTATQSATAGNREDELGEQTRWSEVVGRVGLEPTTGRL